MNTQSIGFKENKVKNGSHGFPSYIEQSFLDSFFTIIKKLFLQYSIPLQKKRGTGSKLQLNSIFPVKWELFKNKFVQKLISNKKKTFFSLKMIVFCAVLFMGCSKTADTVETKDELVARLLTGGGNKVWRLAGLFVNDIAQTLTDAQMKFTKTYRADPTNADPANPKTGAFTNSDGYIGTWKLINGAAQLYEKFTNNPVGPVAVPYIINSISDSKLDIEYTQNFKSVREVYNGF